MSEQSLNAILGSSAAALASERSLRVTSLPTLRHQIVDRMREAIETGQFPPGARLVERDLCERMGVSRT
ncbi:GntR family transcriptional regulator, partial [Proteus mirabilis]|uniref:GntR family transcriptional regulator n=1 Tax=Proteus mirabilis TaxID=584 RepID=UPI0013D4B9F4